VVEPLLHQLPEVVLLLEVPPLRRPKKRRKKKVWIPLPVLKIVRMLTFSLAKEESDEDMGFGLFD
jgi:hypothetical protein